MTTKFERETEDNPKMLQVFLKDAYHEVFCYGLAFNDEGKYKKKLLFTIISGSDSALQSMKAAIDLGSKGGVSFGYGEKGTTDYRFKQELVLEADKGKYETFNMSLSRTRKAVAIVHESILNNSEYVLSFNESPARDIAQLLGGSQYGLYILPEWEEIVLSELIRCEYLVEHDLYVDKELFPEGLHLFSVNLSEEQADKFIEGLIKEGKITFPRNGTGAAVEEIEDLTAYLLNYNEAMVHKLAETVTPGHDPLKDSAMEIFDSYPRELFPVQAHSATAVVKRLKKAKAVILQGEMSTGKSAMMTAIGDGVMHALKGDAGYHVCLMCPPSLTSKWPLEIKAIIPHAKVIVIDKTDKLIAFHREWVANGRQKPKVPTFFVISFTTMRGDARSMPGVSYKKHVTTIQKIEQTIPYRNGYYCRSCGKPHQTIESTSSEIDETGNEIELQVTHNMTRGEFGETRRIHNGAKPANSFCSHCGDTLWTKVVPTRFDSFKEWSTHEKRLVHAINQNNPSLYEQVQSEKPDYPKAVGMPRRVAAIEYIRRKMNDGFLDFAIVDEVHMLKAGNSAQGHSLGSLAKVAKKVIAGTGTLFGGKAEDIYYLLWRLFPHDMAESGYKFEEVSRFNDEYGNVEETVYERNEGSTEYSNTNSRGGDRRTTKKVMPGISPFIFGKYMVQNVINVRLKDVWPDPVELVDTPTIFVPMSDELNEHYHRMINAFEREIDKREDGYKLYMQMTDYGIAYPDNPFHFPDATFKMSDGNRDLIWSASHLNEDCTLPKEKKLQEIITSEMSEGRKSIVYVRDTGTSVADRDVRPRLKQKLEEIGAKVCVLDTSTTKTYARSEWLEKKMLEEGYDVCIVSQELVQVGLDLLCTPTLIYYQFSWSLFTINQSSRRAWRIGQHQECRLFYLAYENSFQQHMAEIIAKKNRATAAINGEVSSDGLSAMLGDEGDLQSMLIQTVKNGGTILKGSAEDWISQSSDRARELLAGIGKKREKEILPSLLVQFEHWVAAEIKEGVTKERMLERKEALVSNINKQLIPGFTWNQNVLEVDFLPAFGFDREFVSDGAILAHLCKPQMDVRKKEKELLLTITTEETPILPLGVISMESSLKKRKKGKKLVTSEEQLVFDLFA